MSEQENQEAQASVEDFPRQVREIFAYLGDYLDAKWDLSKASLRDALLQIVLWSWLVLLGSGLILLAVTFLFYGFALAVTEWLGGREWAGYLISGGGLLLIFYLPIHFKIASNRRKSLKKKTEAYERKLEEQREKFGFNAVERAAAE